MLAQDRPVIFCEVLTYSETAKSLNEILRDYHYDYYLIRPDWA